VFGATCGHSDFIHSDIGDRRYLYAECARNVFIVGATQGLQHRSYSGSAAPWPEGSGAESKASVLSPPAHFPAPHGDLFIDAEEASASWPYRDYFTTSMPSCLSCRA
jgi:hypothetical protein